MTDPRDQGLMPTLRGVRVLLAEDEPMAAKLARGVLRTMGITEVTHVTDGSQALKALDAAEGKFELIISDWNMPKVNGIEFLRQVRLMHPNMKFLMLTGHADREIVLAAKQNRVDAYVVKPFSPGQLKAKVETLLKF
jgi:two-component system, chemotaxis family, chemotaxis protein CheY